MMAWLHATPKPPPQSRRAKADVSLPKISRFEQMKKDGIVPQMPPNPMPHIVSQLVEIGLVEAAGMGTGPVGWLTIGAWCSLTGIDLPPWEARLIRKLSVEYVAEGRRAESENYPAPFKMEVTQRERDIEQARLEAVLG